MFDVLLAIGTFVGLLLLGVPVAFALIAGSIIGLFAIGHFPWKLLRNSLSHRFPNTPCSPSRSSS